MPSKEHLTFESQTPTFLRRLRGEIPSGPSGEPTDPDRHTTPQIRARRPRDQADIEEDEPVYVDAETGHVVSKDDARRNLDPTEPTADDEIDKTADTIKPVTEDQEKVSANAAETVKAKKDLASIGTNRRKGNAPRIVGGDQAIDFAENEDEASISAPKRKTVDDSTSNDRGAQGQKIRKKGKKIKLSFDDDV